MLEQGLFTLITENAGVSAIVADRLYPVQGPPDDPTYPYITYESAAADSEYSTDGAEARTKTIKFDTWDPSALVNLQILAALRNVLTGFVGTLNDGTRVLFTKRANEMAFFDNDQKEYISFCEYEFQFVEP